MRAVSGTAALVAACVLGLVACGDGGGSTKAAAGGDQAAAAKIVLLKSDFPAGWTSTPHQATPADDTTRQQFAQCLGIPDPKTLQTGDAQSPDFAKGQTTTASSEARFVHTDAQASAALAAYQTGKGTDCFKQTLTSALPGQLPQGATTSNLAVQQLTFPTLKDGTAAYQASLTVSIASGISVPVYVDLVIFRAGRAEVTLTTVNTGSPFDSGLEKKLAQNLAARA